MSVAGPGDADNEQGLDHDCRTEAPNSPALIGVASRGRQIVLLSRADGLARSLCSAGNENVPGSETRPWQAGGATGI